MVQLQSSCSTNAPRGGENCRISHERPKMPLTAAEEKAGQKVTELNRYRQLGGADSEDLFNPFADLLHCPVDLPCYLLGVMHKGIKDLPSS